MQTDVPSHIGSSQHLYRSSFRVDTERNDEEPPYITVPRRFSNDSANKKRALQNWRNCGPPMIIREKSDMSMISDFTPDFTQHSADAKSENDSNREAQKRMSQIMECSGSFATLKVLDKDEKRDKGEELGSIALGSIALGSIALESTVKQPSVPEEHVIEQQELCIETVGTKNCVQSSDSYVRQLEIDLISLKMKMADAQSQIDQQQMMTNREQMTLQKHQEILEMENQTLKLENDELKYQLQEERDIIRKMRLKLAEQDKIILKMKGSTRNEGFFRENSHKLFHQF